MGVLKENTVATNPETGVPTSLAKGQEVPEWAAGLVGEHLVEGGAEAGTEAGTADAGSQEDEVPPKAGRGSGLEAWQKYADDHGIQYAEDATRDEIIAAVESAK